MGHDVHIFEHKQTHITAFPQWEDFEIVGSGIPTVNLNKMGPIYPTKYPAPDWFHVVKDYKDADIDADILIIWGTPGLPLIDRLPKRYIMGTWGGDITIVPFETKSRDKANMRKLLREAEKVLITNTCFFPFADRLGLDNTVYMPFAIDTETHRSYSPEENQEARRGMIEGQDADIVIINMARQDFKWKGSDKILRAFSALLMEEVDARLVLTSWGNDLIQSKALIRKLSIVDRVHWVPIMSRPTLARAVSAADIALDQFGSPYPSMSFGAAGLEAMATTTPLITKLTLGEYDEHYNHDLPPVLVAEDSQEIFENMLRLSEDALHRKVSGVKGRNWILKHHKTEKVAKRDLQEYEEVVKSQDI